MRFNYTKTQGHLFLINFVEIYESFLSNILYTNSNSYVEKIIISVTNDTPCNIYNSIKDKVPLRKYFEKCCYIKE